MPERVVMFGAEEAGWKMLGWRTDRLSGWLSMAQLSFANVLQRPEADRKTTLPLWSTRPLWALLFVSCLSRKGRLTDNPEQERWGAGTRLRRHGNSLISASRVGFRLADVKLNLGMIRCDVTPPNTNDAWNSPCQKGVYILLGERIHMTPTPGSVS